MIKKAFIIILSIGIMLFNIPVGAESSTTMEVSYSAEKVSVTLSGTAYGRAGVIITEFSVLPENITGDDILYWNQFIAVGKYSYEINLPSSFQSNKYSVILTTADGEASGSFFHMNEEDAVDVLDDLSKVGSENEFAAFIESGDNAKTLGIDKEDAYYEKNKEYTYKLLYALNKNYDNPVSFNELYHKLYAISIIYGGSEAEILDAANKYADNLGVDFTKEFLEDTRISEEGYDYLFSLLSNINYLSEFKERENTDFAALLEEGKYASALESATNWQAVKKAVEEDFKSFFDVNENEMFKNITNKNDVYSKMMKYTYGSYKDVLSGFEGAVEEVYNFENPPVQAPQGGGSGGGGGGGKGTAVEIPADVEETFPTDNKLAFTDFSEKHWSYDAVFRLCKEGYIRGYEDNTFRADNNITRAEFTKIVMDMAEKIAADKEAENADVTFSDVNSGDWFYEKVHKAAKSGYVNGSDGLFRPHDNITREDAAVIIYRMLSAQKTVSGNKVFPDRSEISGYARDAVAALGATGIVSGDGDGFKPKNLLTRAQASQLIYNVLGFIG